MLPFARSSGNLHLQCFLPGYNTALLIGFMNSKGDLLLGPVKHFLKEQGQPCMNIFTAHAHALPETTSTRTCVWSATEYLLKKVTELTGICIGVSTATKTRSALPTGGRLEGSIGLCTVFTQLVVFCALFGVFQHLVSLAEIFKLLVGIFLFTDIRMILPCQLPIGFFDFLGGGRLTHTKHGVIVFEVH